MDSHGNREQKRLLLEPKRAARFFQLILEEQLGEGRLVIPTKFANKYGNDLLNEVFLEVPNGTVWKVELLKCHDRLWLQNGWREFQEYYSLGHGTFLVFEYTSRSYFHVVICDKSASEIDYPFNAYDECKEPKFGGDSDEARTRRKGGDNERTKISNDRLPLSKKRKKLALPCPRPSKMGRTSSTAKSEAKRFNENISSSEHGKNRISKNKKVLGNDEKTKALRRASRSSDIQEFTTSMKSLKAFAEAACLKDKNPSFSAVIQPSHVNHKSYTSIPLKFAKTYLRKKRGNVLLQTSQRKIWNVNFRIYDKKSKRAKFSSGWFAFVRNNNLAIGDVCVFELIDRAKLLLKVVIDRASKQKFLLQCPCSADKTMKTAKLDSSELHTNVAPVNHQLSCIKSENTTGDIHLSDPKLQSEDTCKEKGFSGNEHKASRKNAKRKSLKAYEKAKALTKAGGAFKSENPFFMLAIQPAYIGGQLNLPFEFAKSYFKEENGEIVLQVSDGRTWTIDYSVKSQQRKALFSCSWTAFVRDNNLAVGDVCIFELIKSTKIVLKVTISRAGDCLPSFGKITVNEEKPDKGLPERRSCSMVPEIIEAAENFTSIYPSFKVFMRISNLQGKVTVPAKFMKFIKQGTEKVLKLRLRVGDNMWPVKLTRKCKIGKLTSGWNVFSGENQLQVGDFCVFELVDSESLQLKVSILRHNG